MKQEPNNADQQIDLAEVSRKVKNFFSSISDGIFSFILFIQQQAIKLLILLIIGIGAGIYFDSIVKSYKSEVIVIPNFGSVDYLYSKVNLLKSKIKENDKDFFRNIGIKQSDVVLDINVKPVNDVYNFVNNNERNFELLRLMAEDGDVTEVIEDKATSKNFTYHLITIICKDKQSSQKITDLILRYFNDTDYYKALQKEYVTNLKNKITANEAMITQIDNILESFAKEKPTQGVYINENAQLNDLIKNKDALIAQKGELRISFINYSEIIKANSITVNIKNTESLNGKLKIILPLVLIFFYLTGLIFIRFYKKQIVKRSV